MIAVPAALKRHSAQGAVTASDEEQGDALRHREPAAHSEPSRRVKLPARCMTRRPSGPLRLKLAAGPDSCLVDRKSPALPCLPLARR